MFVFDKCCFCIELRTGCLIIAYVQLFAEAVTFVLELHGIVSGTGLITSTVKLVSELGYILLMFSVLLLAFLGLMFIFTVVLIIGLHKSNRDHIRAYLICALIFVIVYATTVFISYPMLNITILDISYKVISLAMYVYFIIVIRSYWMKMRRNSLNTYGYTNVKPTESQSFE